MYKQVLSFLLGSMVIYSCSNKKKAAPVKDKVSIADSVVANDTTRQIIRFDNQLKQLAAIPDSLAGYIKLNMTAYDSVKKWRNAVTAGKYLDSIIVYHKRIEEDTALKRVLAKAYIWRSFDNFVFSYKPTVVEDLELFLLLAKTDSTFKRWLPLAYNNLGIQYNILGDLKKTSFYYSLFIKYGKETKTWEYYYSGLGNSIISLNEMGYYDSVVSLVEPVLPLTNMEPKRKAALFTGLSEAYLQLNDFPKSKETAQRGISFLNTAQSQKRIENAEYLDYISQLYQQLGLVYTEEDKIPEAKEAFSKAEQYYLQKSNNNLKDRKAGKLFLSQVRLYEKTGELDKALHLCQKALYSVTKVDSNKLSQLPQTIELYTENTIMEALDKKAGMLEKVASLNTKDIASLTQIVQCYDLAFTVERKLMQGFSYDESLMRQAKESRQRSERAIEACYKLYLVSGSTYWAEKALLFAETSKAIVLQESVRRNLAATKVQTGDTGLQKVQLYQQQVSYYEKRLAIIPDSAKEENIKLKNQLSIAEQNLLMAKTALSRNHTAYREALLQGDTVSIDNIRSKLATKNTTLTEYFWGDSSQYIFQLSTDRSITFFKASSSLPVLTKQYLSFFANKNKINNEPQAYEKAAYNLFQALHLDSLVSDSPLNLIIIPDNILSLVPFESLVTKITGSASPREFVYLLLNKQISYGFSAVTLIRQAENRTANKGTSCFAPVFAGGERGNTPLLNTETELASIREEKPAGHYFLKENASIANFKKNTNNDILHIASHAHSDTSGGMPVIEFYDSTLYLNEIYTLPLSAHLIVLSACETGIGKIDKSEGAMSLARGFYYAGAKNIITSLWSVDDKSTGTIFGLFYHTLSYDNYSSSLRKSKLTYLQNTSATTASPYYWAGFIHIGHDDDHHNGKRLPAWLIISATGILLLIAFSVLQKKK
jgi:CHAT domain-containing protein